MQDTLIIISIMTSIVILFTLLYQTSKSEDYRDVDLDGPIPSPTTPIPLIRMLVDDLINRRDAGVEITLQEAMIPLNLISEHRYHPSFDRLPEPEREEIRRILRSVSEIVRGSRNLFTGN